MVTTFSMNGRYVSFVFAIIGVLLAMMFIMLGIAVNPDPRNIFMTFLLIVILTLIVIVGAWSQKLTLDRDKITDHSLKDK